MKAALVLLSLICLLHAEETTNPSFEFSTVQRPTGSNIVFSEVFDDEWQDRWTISKHKDFEGEWRVEEGRAPFSFVGEKGLVVGSAAKKHAIVAPFQKVLDNTDKEELVVQYEVKLQKSLDCGGAYLKLLTASSMPKPDEFSNETPYTIMFGPDKCGEQDKVHFIIRHKNPISKVYEEKHLTNPPKIKRDTQTHLYTLVIRKDDTFQVLIDQEVVRSGNFGEDFQPPFTPPKEIDDPEDKKPADWVDEAKIPDPEATKPDDWDEDAPATITDLEDKKPETWLDHEPAEISDPEVTKPEDWDDELDGEWEARKIQNPKCLEFGCGEWKARQIPNPAYKGKWRPPMIDNPAYKGEWKPKQIPNPNYFEASNIHKLEPIGGLGIELWTMTDSIMFDNFLVTHSKEKADSFASQTWVKKFAAESQIKAEEDAKNSPSILDQIQSTLEPLLQQFMKWATNPDNTVIVAVTVAAAVAIPLLSCIFFCSRSEETPIPTSTSSPSSSSSPSPKSSKKSEAKGQSSRKRKED